MLPIPSRTAIAAFIATLICLVLGALSGSIAATAVGSAGAIGLSAALAATMPLGRRVRRQRLEFAWWLAHGDPTAGGGAVVPGTPFDIRCFLRHRGDEALTLEELDPLLPPGIEWLDEHPDSLDLVPGSRTEFQIRLVAPATGRVVLHGLAVMLQGPFGLFSVPLYFPNPLAIKVLPQAASRLVSRARAMPGLPVERAGTRLIAPHGGGTEIRELRDMQPGDPFKSIAWKPSSRRGKLLVREVDQEVQETRYVVLDISGTMRGGALGRRKLDHAIEAVAAAARRSLGNGDRFGLITADGRALTHLTPKDGNPQLLRVFDALLAATEVVDQDLTESDDDEVLELVGQYVRQQDGVDFTITNRRGARWNVSMLVRHVTKALGSENIKEEPLEASSPALAVLRRFCRLRGIQLRYRSEPRDGTKANGLSLVLRDLAKRSFGPMSIDVVSDLDTLGDPTPLIAAVKLLRIHGHTVSFAVHLGSSFCAIPETSLETELYQIYARGEARVVEEVRRLLAPLGVPLRVIQHSDAAAVALAGQHAMPRRRAIA